MSLNINVIIYYFISEANVSVILQFCDGENDNFTEVIYYLIIIIKNNKLFSFIALKLPVREKHI